MGRFISDEKLARVRVCATTGQELVESFGTPSGQGRDGDMGTLTWNAAAFAVNPAGIPQKPAPCREQAPNDSPDPAPAPVEKAKQARRAYDVKS